MNNLTGFILKHLNKCKCLRTSPNVILEDKKKDSKENKDAEVAPKHVTPAVCGAHERDRCSYEKIFFFHSLASECHPKRKERNQTLFSLCHIRPLLPSC